MSTYFQTWRNTFNIKGCSTRSEFWPFVIINWALVFVTTMLTLAAIGLNTGSGSILGLIVALVVFGLYLFQLVSLVPTFTAMVRRLHDAGFSGFWCLLSIVPFGGFVVLVLLLLPSKFEANKYRVVEAQV